MVYFFGFFARNILVLSSMTVFHAVVCFCLTRHCGLVRRRVSLFVGCVVLHWFLKEFHATLGAGVCLLSLISLFLSYPVCCCLIFSR